MSRLITALTALSIALLATGCVTRQVTRFEDNQKSPLTLLEVKKTTSYLVFPGPVVYQFYMCQDAGEKLICKLSCDGQNDVVCPAATAGGGMTTSNVR